MTYIYLYSSNSPLPSLGSFGFDTSYVPPAILPNVSIDSSFSTDIFAGNFISPFLGELSGSYARGNYGGPDGVSRQAPGRPPITLGISGAFVYKQITNMEWVKNGGPLGNGVAYNERGDWFTEAALSTPDFNGEGIRLDTFSRSGNVTETIPNAAADGGTGSVSYSAFPFLRLHGQYNGSVFCYNDFGYLTDHESGADKVRHAKSLYELPNKFDQLVNFIPDQRSSTTLTFTVRVSYNLITDYGSFGNFLTTAQKNQLTSSYTSNGYSSSGTELHAVSQVISNNSSNWSQILKDILKTRQRSHAEQDALYNTTAFSKVTTFTPTGG
jgi:hypothetical protein